MIITITAKGKWNSFTTDNKEYLYVTPSKKLTTPIEVGESYEAELWKPQGKKTIYITKATKISNKTAESLQQIKTDLVAQKAEEKIKTIDIDKMTKADWAKKDDGIKWLTCIKASAEFHARRADSTIIDIVKDARLLYTANCNIIPPPEQDIYSIDQTGL